MRKFFVILLLAGVGLSAQAQFEEGKHYKIVGETASAEPKVTEFFSLFCGHCFQFETLVDYYKKGLKSGTKFEKSHVSFIPRNNEPVSFGIVKAFLTIKALKKEDTLIKAIFDDIHVKRKEVNSEEQIKALFVAHGVSGADFDKHYQDDRLIAEAKVMTEVWKERGIGNVPTMVVNDKYRINMGSVKSLDELVALSNYLLEKK